MATTAQSLRGVAFRDGEATRGLAWSDTAILLRSVKQNGAAITAALHAAGIPCVVSGWIHQVALRNGELHPKLSLHPIPNT